MGETPCGCSRWYCELDQLQHAQGGLMKQLPPTAFIIWPLSSSCIVSGYVHLMNTEYSQPALCDINCTFSVDQLMKLEFAAFTVLKERLRAFQGWGSACFYFYLL